jgi:peptidyl-prolyl cis-trans isomerase SurA
MKKISLILLAFTAHFMAIGQTDPVLMEINGQAITKSEFLQIYLKNNPNPKYDKASLDEYMELFKKFKLKVIEAEQLKYDTIPKLKKELDGYKKQLSNPYLVDQAKNEELVKQAYDRTIEEVRASHILIRVESTASPADTLAAYNRILGLKSRIEKGEDFNSVAKSKNGSEDPSAASNGGDLGFFNAFQMVYPFEEAAFTTLVGKVSEPFRTRFGYHIVKVTGKRPARGTIKTAHIMVATPKSATPEEITNAEKKINELYDKLLKGEKFEDLAKDHSDDPSSNMKGGELPPFGTGTTTRMVPSFEDAAFALKNDGDYSAPIKTDYGFHIVKRLSWNAVKPYEDMKKELQGKVNRDERAKKTQDSFVSKLKTQYNYQDVSSKNAKWFIKNLDTTYFIGKWNSSTLKSDKPLFMLDGKAFGQKQFAEYLTKNYRNVKKDINENVVKIQLKNWEKEAVLAYEESQLTKKYPEYKALLNEYHDGILLYEIMTDKVWNKAIKDTVGLKTYFENNRDNYKWGNRTDAVIYECLNQPIADQVSKMLKNDTINSKHVLEVVNKESELNLRVKTNKFDNETTPFIQGRILKQGLNPSFELDGKVYVIKVNELLSPRNKEFNEAKGVITSDYQNYLEKKWLDELNKKYKITINESVLYSIGK